MSTCKVTYAYLIVQLKPAALQQLFSLKQPPGPGCQGCCEAHPTAGIGGLAGGFHHESFPAPQMTDTSSLLSKPVLIITVLRTTVAFKQHSFRTILFCFFWHSGLWTTFYITLYKTPKFIKKKVLLVLM